jgi:hypothetical protein
MRVRSGWNSEPYGRRKFDIELGEEDFVRICATHGISPEEAAAMPLREVYKIIYCEAEILARAALVRHLENDQAGDEAVSAVKAEIAQLTRERNAALEPHKPRPRAARAKEPAGA